MFQQDVKYSSPGAERLPDHVQVHSEISVCNGVSHAINAAPGNFRVARREIRMTAPYALRGLADDLDIPDHRILLFLAGKESGPVHTRKIAADTPNRAVDMPEIVPHPQDRILFHTGCASASTFSRIVSGSAPGVSTSTSMPSNSLSSN